MLADTSWSHEFKGEKEDKDGFRNESNLVR